MMIFFGTRNPSVVIAPTPPLTNGWGDERRRRLVDYAGLQQAGADGSHDVSQDTEEDMARALMRRSSPSSAARGQRSARGKRPEHSYLTPARRSAKLFLIVCSRRAANSLGSLVALLGLRSYQQDML